MQKNVHWDYVQKLKMRHYPLSQLPDQYLGCSLPLHVILTEACFDDKQWNDVERLLSKLPPRMAEQAILWKDDRENLHYPLHITAVKAPRFIFQKMLPPSIYIGH